MGAANVNVTVIPITPIGGTPNSGWKIGFIDSAAKAAQNDTWTLLNVTEIGVIVPVDDSDGLLGIPTVSGNVVTLTSASTGACSAMVIYR